MGKHILSYIAVLFILFSLFTFLSCEKEDLSNLDDLIYVRHKGADMPAYIYGNASEKVFIITLHGGPGGFGLLFRANCMKDKIEKSCAVVYFDQRGCGMSQGQYSKDEFNIDIMTEDVMALVKVLQYKYGDDSRFFLMGHSWGGTLGTATLLKDINQNYFKGWINIDGPYDIGQYYFEVIDYLKVVAKEQINAGNHEQYWRDISDEMYSIDTTKFSWDDVFYMNNKGNDAQNILTQDGIINSGGNEAGLDYLVKNNLLTFSWNSAHISADKIISINLSYTNELEKIHIPSLILWGKYDLTVPPRIGQVAYDNIGANRKKIVFFEKSGHAPVLSEPDKFVDEVLDFINENK